MDQADELCFGILGGAERGTRTVQSGHTHSIYQNKRPPHFVGISNLTAGNFLFGFRIFLYPKLSSGSGFSFVGFPHTKWSLQTLEDFFGIHILPFGFCLLMALAHRVRASLFLRSVGK